MTKDAEWNRLSESIATLMVMLYEAGLVDA